MPEAPGAIPSRVSSLLLDRSCMAISLPPFDSHLRVASLRGVLLWHERVVSAVRIDLPTQHHRVILVNHVMAVQRVAAGPVAESEEELNPLVRTQLCHVLTRALHRERRRDTVAR